VVDVSLVTCIDLVLSIIVNFKYYVFVILIKEKPCASTDAEAGAMLPFRKKNYTDLIPILLCGRKIEAPLKT
jgi:hypothetical protein